MAANLRPPPASATVRGVSRSCSKLTPMTRASSGDCTSPPSSSKKRKQISPTAPRAARSRCSSLVITPALSRRRREGVSRPPMPVRIMER
ncbi:MAG: hypothetical protein QM767_03015 [Anaeromyxobacter sp.]